jgi:hypothetical protein
MDIIGKIKVAKEEADASSDVIQKVRELVEEGARLQDTVDSLQEALKATVGRFNRIKQYELPKLMKDNGIGKFDSLDGTIKTKFESYVSGSLPKEEFEKEQALQYLESLDGASLIKTLVSVKFPKNMHNAAKDFYTKILELLREYDPNEEVEFEPDFKEGVHAATLQAFAREKLKKGEELEWEKLGLAVGHHVKFEFYEMNEKGKLVKKKKLSTEEGTSDE